VDSAGAIIQGEALKEEKNKNRIILKRVDSFLYTAATEEESVKIDQGNRRGLGAYEDK